MTTYLAKQVIGSDVAQNPAGALLQSGANRADDSTTGDTWLFLDTVGGTANPWGIMHSQGNNKIKIFGGGTEGAWVRMNTGDTYLLGKVGIGYDPDTSGNTYKLYVNGTSYFNDNIYMTTGKTIGAADTQYRPFQLYLGRNTTSGSNALNSNNPLIEFSNGDRSQYCQLIYDDYDSLMDPDSLTLVGNQNGIKFVLKNGPLWIQGGSNAGGNVNRLTTTSGTPGNMQYNVSRRGTQIYSNGIAFADPYNGNSNNDAGWIRHQETTANAGELEIAVGDDGNEVVVVRQYKTDNTVNRTLTLLNASGYMLLPSYIYVPTSNNENPTVSQFIVTNGSDHYYRKASVAHVASAVDGQHKWVRISGDTMTGVLTTSYKSGTWVNSLTSSAITLSDTSGSYGGWICGPTKNGRIAISTYQNSDDLLYIGYGERGRTTNSFTRSMTWNGANGRLTTASVANAIWNDYAECRIADTIEPGYCVTETQSGKMTKTNKRLMPGCKLISDTYGVIMGETSSAQTPIAVAGRVLAYTYQDRNNYPLGAAVCSAPDGTIDIMTRDEIMMYPERIIGIVSEIPDYEIWEAGENGEKKIPVNSRIWVYVK